MQGGECSLAVAIKSAYEKPQTKPKKRVVKCFIWIALWSIAFAMLIMIYIDICVISKIAGID